MTDTTEPRSRIDGVTRAMTRQVRAAWVEAGPLTMNGGAATRAFDNWHAAVQAEPAYYICGRCNTKCGPSITALRQAERSTELEQGSKGAGA